MVVVVELAIVFGVGCGDAPWMLDVVLVAMGVLVVRSRLSVWCGMYPLICKCGPRVLVAVRVPGGGDGGVGCGC